VVNLALVYSSLMSVLYVLLGFYIVGYLRCIIQCCPSWQLVICMTDYDCCVCWHINVDHHHHYYYYLQCTKYDKILFTLFRLGILAVQKKISIQRQKSVFCIKLHGFHRSAALATMPSQVTYCNFLAAAKLANAQNVNVASVSTTLSRGNVWR